jgi:hypothetical protein
MRREEQTRHATHYRFRPADRSIGSASALGCFRYNSRSSPGWSSDPSPSSSIRRRKCPTSQKGPCTRRLRWIVVLSTAASYGPVLSAESTRPPLESTKFPIYGGFRVISIAAVENIVHGVISLPKGNGRASILHLDLPVRHVV